MIEIIKRGTKKITKCNFCGCEFSYEEEDLQYLNYVEGKFVPGINHGYKRYVLCPQCEKEIAVAQTRGINIE